jgi:hypothetical protein
LGGVENIKSNCIFISGKTRAIGLGLNHVYSS